MENINLENVGGNKIQKLQKRLLDYVNELKGIEKFVTEQLQDIDDLKREFRFDMFARHFAEVFSSTGLLRKVERAIKNKEGGVEELSTLASEFERQMNFFRMFKNKKWEPPK